MHPHSARERGRYERESLSPKNGGMGERKVYGRKGSFHFHIHAARTLERRKGVREGRHWYALPCGRRRNRNRARHSNTRGGMLLLLLCRTDLPHQQQQRVPVCCVLSSHHRSPHATNLAPSPYTHRCWCVRHWSRQVVTQAIVQVVLRTGRSKQRRTEQVTYMTELAHLAPSDLLCLLFLSRAFFLSLSLLRPLPSLLSLSPSPSDGLASLSSFTNSLSLSCSR